MTQLRMSDSRLSPLSLWDRNMMLIIKNKSVGDTQLWVQVQIFPLSELKVELPGYYLPNSSLSVLQSVRPLHRITGGCKWGDLADCPHGTYAEGAHNGVC